MLSDRQNSSYAKSTVNSIYIHFNHRRGGGRGGKISRDSLPDKLLQWVAVVSQSTSWAAENYPGFPPPQDSCPKCVFGSRITWFDVDLRRQ